MYNSAVYILNNNVIEWLDVVLNARKWGVDQEIQLLSSEPT